MKVEEIRSIVEEGLWEDMPMSQESRPEVLPRPESEKTDPMKPAVMSNGPPVSLEDVVAELNDISGIYDVHLSFDLDKDLAKNVIKIIDNETNRVIRQIPLEGALRIRDALHEMRGVILNENA